MDREARLAGPPIFMFTVQGGGQIFPDSKPPGRLTSVGFDLARDGGIATNLALKAPNQGITAQMVKARSSEDCDHFSLSFKPDGASFLPDTWDFGLTYIDRDQKPHERSYTVTFHPAQKIGDPLNVDVREKLE